MQCRFFGQKLLVGLFKVLVGHTAVNRANGGALGLVVKAFALGAFIGNDKIHIHAAGCLRVRGIGFKAGAEAFEHACQGGSIGKAPLGAAFVYSVIGAFRLAGPAVYALISYFNGHFA
jgi:hypothetical protein